MKMKTKKPPKAILSFTQTITHQLILHMIQMNQNKKIQNDGDTVVSWFEKNDMVCSSDKTKLLIIGTKRNRINKLENNNTKLNINICGEQKEESESEKLLGVIVNNILTWKDHIYGNDENPGLLKQLSKRIGILKKLRPLMSDKKFKQVVCGTFYQ